MLRFCILQKICYTNDYKGNVGLFKDTDTPSNPFYKAFGNNWVSEIYCQIYDMSREKGIVIGKNLILVDNEAGMYFQGKKVDLITNYLFNQKNTISQRLNIPLDEVQIGIGMQMHMSPNPEGGNYFKIPT